MMPSVLKYADYRTFLNDYYQTRKQRGSWGLAVWGKQLGVRSPSTLFMIMKGVRHPGHNLVQNLCRYFKFDNRESEHFSNLVRLSKCTNDTQLSVMLLQQLAKNYSDGTFNRLSHERFLAISNWYYYSIRELVSLPRFRENVTWLSQKFNFDLSSKEIKGAIDHLLRLGLLVRNANKQLEATDVHVDTSSEFADEGLKRFHEQSLQNAQIAVRKNSPEQRELQGVTLRFSRKDMERAKAMIRNFVREFGLAFDSNNADAVYQLEMAFFPTITLPSEREYEN